MSSEWLQVETVSELLKQLIDESPHAATIKETEVCDINSTTFKTPVGCRSL